MINVRIVALALMLLPTGGGAQLASKCDAAKWKAAGKHVKCLTGVEAKAAKNGAVIAPDDPALAMCDEKFLTKCSKAETQTDCSKPATCTTIRELHRGQLDEVLGLIR